MERSHLKLGVCALSDPDLGIITENDHKVGQCLCKFCNCGSHTCPYSNVKLSVTVKSNYSREFFPKQCETRLKRKPKEYRPNPLPMDLKTMNMAEYVNYPQYTRVSAMTPVYKKIEQTILGVSDYKRQFLDWGPREVEYTRKWHPTTRSTGIAFKASSKYQEEFQAPKYSFSKRPVPKGTFSLGPNELIEYNSTYMRTMKGFSSSVFESPKKSIVHNTERVKTPVNQFLTTSGSTYKPVFPDLKDPSLLKCFLRHK